jgi:predicted DNA-binding ribbon-helix-helix protein
LPNAPLWCNVVHSCLKSGRTMSTHAKQSTKSQDHHKSVRTSVSLPPDLHDTLERLAKGKKVSVAWVIRDAAEKYVSEQWPLLQGENP